MIFVAAGHYPSKPGARFGRFNEHDEAIVWQRMLCEELGDDATLVPSGPLREKAGFINERCVEGDVALELHFNSAVDKEGNRVGEGSVTLYYPGSEKGKTLAQICQGALAGVFPPDRGVKEGWYRGDESRGAYFFLEKTRIPAVILEPEFVHRNELIKERRHEAVVTLAGELYLFYGGQREEVQSERRDDQDSDARQETLG